MVSHVFANSASVLQQSKIGLKDLALLFFVVYVLVLSFVPSKKAHLQLAPK